jgi:hypothetical protein
MAKTNFVVNRLKAEQTVTKYCGTRSEVVLLHSGEFSENP